MVTHYFVRHAKAGSRSDWDDADDLRPLVKSGRKQAEALLELLADVGIQHIVSSPYVRCRQSVEPLAEWLRLPVELNHALTEGAPLSETLRLIEKYADVPAVFCSHADVIATMLEHVLELGVDLGPDPRCEKGSTWALDDDAGEVRAARYLPPPH
jgi:broad specificity phosphatase PhoE